MFKYTEKVGEKMATYEADTAQNVADLVNAMNSNKSTTTDSDVNGNATGNINDNSVVIGQLS